MVRNKPRVSIQEISANFREVDLAFTSRVLATGNALRIRIPSKEAKFWDIRPRDEVHVKVTQLKRDSELAGHA